LGKGLPAFLRNMIFTNGLRYNIFTPYQKTFSLISLKIITKKQLKSPQPEAVEQFHNQFPCNMFLMRPQWAQRFSRQSGKLVLWPHGSDPRTWCQQSQKARRDGIPAIIFVAGEELNVTLGRDYVNGA